MASRSMRDTPRPLTYRQKVAVIVTAATFSWIALIASIHSLADSHAPDLANTQPGAASHG